MVTELMVNPARFSQFGQVEDSVFCLITNPEVVDQM